MKGDFTRLTFDPKKHYRGVLMQQGRVQLDADWNEQLQIAEHRITNLFSDFVGQNGVPDGENGGFEIKGDAGKMLIGKGHCYVDGSLVENDNEIPFVGHYPGADLKDARGEALPNGNYLAYLDVWPRHITWLEDPSLREVALGGADTTTRIQNAWQVKLLPIQEDKTEESAWDTFLAVTKSTGSLSVSAASSPQFQNQLYRVEIHEGNFTESHSGKPAGGVTFKWSRDNGAATAGIIAISVTDKTAIATLGICSLQAEFAADQWIELLDDSHEFQGKPGVLAQIQRIEGQNLILGVGEHDRERLKQEFKFKDNNGSDLHTKARRWDSVGAEAIGFDKPRSLDRLMGITFSSGFYRRGDYWLIPTRSLASIDWPYTEAQLPEGVTHHYCKLAKLTLADGKVQDDVEDLRIRFKPLATGLVSKAGDTMTGALVIKPVPVSTESAEPALSVIGDVRVEGSDSNGKPHITLVGSNSPYIDLAFNEIKRAARICNDENKLRLEAWSGSAGELSVIDITGFRYDENSNRIPNNCVLHVTGDIRATGEVTGTNVKSPVSDVRLKQNIETIGSALGMICRLRGVSFEWNAETAEPTQYVQGKHIGVIAQEVETVLPELVSTNQRGYKTIDYVPLIAVLIEAIKELRTENKQLQDRVTAIETSSVPIRT